MLDSLAFRAARETDVPKVLELLELAFERWPSARIDPSGGALEHLGWKMHSTPAAMSTHVLGEAGSQLVACQLRVRRQISVQGQRLPAQSGSDTAVHPDWQGRGLYNAMKAFSTSAAIADGIPLQLDHAVNPAIVRSWERLEYFRLANRPRVFVKPLSPLRYSLSRANDASSRLRFPPALLKLLVRSRLRRRVGARSSAAAALEIDSLPRFDERFDELAEEVEASFDFIAVRSSAYLTWRYRDPRGGRYQIRVAGGGGRLLGYAVLSLVRGGALIADLLARPARLDAVEALISDAIALARSEGAHSVECQLPTHHPYVPILQREGFLAANEDRAWGVAALAIDRNMLAFLNDPKAAVHLTAGDSDVA